MKEISADLKIMGHKLRVAFDLFQYPQEVRTLIYTTNAVEGFHPMLRKFTKAKTIYPTDDGVRKIGLSINSGNIQKVEYADPGLGNYNWTADDLL